MSESSSRRQRKSLEKLVRDVASVMNDHERRRQTVQEIADGLDEHPWRVVDALDAYVMLGGQ